jgi:hypothetical protein
MGVSWSFSDRFHIEPWVRSSHHSIAVGKSGRFDFHRGLLHRWTDVDNGGKRYAFRLPLGAFGLDNGIWPHLIRPLRYVAKAAHGVI